MLARQNYNCNLKITVPNFSKTNELFGVTNISTAEQDVRILYQLKEICIPCLQNTRVSN